MQMQSKPDVEAVFEFVGFRKDNIYEGYRPSHLICENYLTTGIHSYYNLQDVSRGELRGTITFISPESYPHSLWIGKKMAMYEGSNIVGYAIITDILNPILCKCDEFKTDAEVGFERRVHFLEDGYQLE